MSALTAEELETARSVQAATWNLSALLAKAIATIDEQAAERDAALERITALEAALEKLVDVEPRQNIINKPQPPWSAEFQAGVEMGVGLMQSLIEFDVLKRPGRTLEEIKEALGPTEGER